MVPRVPSWVIAAVFAIVSMAAYLTGSDEHADVGVLATVTGPPVVHRTHGGHPPVPASAWEDIGFVVHDADDAAARRAVEEWGSDVLAVYDELPNNASRADLYRYVAVHTNGGWYADADVEPLPPMHDLAMTRDTVLFHEACGRHWVTRLKRDLGVSTILRAPQYKNSVFAAPAGWAPLKMAVDKAVVRARRHVGTYTERDVIEVTGPAVLTDAIELYTATNPTSNPTLVACAGQHFFTHYSLGSWRGPATDTRDSSLPTRRVVDN